MTMMDCAPADQRSGELPVIDCGTLTVVVCGGAKAFMKQIETMERPSSIFESDELSNEVNHDSRRSFEANFNQSQGLFRQALHQRTPDLGVADSGLPGERHEP